MRTLVGMFLFANWAFRGLEVNQLFFLVMAWLACTPANSNIYSVPELLRDVCHACMHVTHAQCDIIRVCMQTMST